MITLARTPSPHQIPQAEAEKKAAEEKAAAEKKAAADKVADEERMARRKAEREKEKASRAAKKGAKGVRNEVPHPCIYFSLSPLLSPGPKGRGTICVPIDQQNILCIKVDLVASVAQGLGSLSVFWVSLKTRPLLYLPTVLRGPLPYPDWRQLDPADVSCTLPDGIWTRTTSVELRPTSVGPNWLPLDSNRCTLTLNRCLSWRIAVTCAWLGVFGPPPR